MARHTITATTAATAPWTAHHSHLRMTWPGSLQRLLVDGLEPFGDRGRLDAPSQGGARLGGEPAALRVARQLDELLGERRGGGGHAATGALRGGGMTAATAAA